jgi:1,4-dihydroxy-2-naphthoyl-CoA synthase
MTKNDASYESILLSLERGIARLTLNRPDKLNSFNVRMHEEVRAALQRVRDEGARVLVLSGAGRGFCAGQDLADRAVAPGAQGVDLGESIERYYKPLVLTLQELPMPVRARTSRSPAISSWRRVRPVSCRHFAGSVWFRTRAAPGAYRASWAARAHSA